MFVIPKAAKLTVAWLSHGLPIGLMTRFLADNEV